MGPSTTGSGMPSYLLSQVDGISSRGMRREFLRTTVQQGRHNLSKRPPRDGAMLVLGQSAGHRDDLDARGRGNSARAPRARGILQTGYAQRPIAPSPFAHREVGTPQ